MEALEGDPLVRPASLWTQIGFVVAGVAGGIVASVTTFYVANALWDFIAKRIPLDPHAANRIFAVAFAGLALTVLVVLCLRWQALSRPFRVFATSVTVTFLAGMALCTFLVLALAGA